MAQNIHHFKNFSIVQDGVEINVDMSKFDKRFNEAQLKLDNAIMTSMVKFMPHQDGNFIAITRGMSQAIAGSGKVIAGAPPSGRFLYEGKTMVDIETGSPWARKGAKKVPVSEYTGKTNVKNEKLQFSKKHNPKVQDHWFDAAKEQFGQNWVELVQKTIRGG